MATLFRLEGGELPVMPNDGKTFTHKELQHLIAGTEEKEVREKVVLQFVPVPDGRIVVCDDNGKVIGLKINVRASEFWQQQYPKNEYPENNDGLLVGNILVVTESEIDDGEEEAEQVEEKKEETVTE